MLQMSESLACRRLYENLACWRTSVNEAWAYVQHPTIEASAAGRRPENSELAGRQQTLLCSCETESGCKRALNNLKERLNVVGVPIPEFIP